MALEAIRFHSALVMMRSRELRDQLSRRTSSQCPARRSVYGNDPRLPELANLLNQTASDEPLKLDGKGARARRSFDFDLDTHRYQKLRDPGGVDQYVVVSFVVSAPRSVFLKDEGRDFSYEPVR